MTNKKKCLTYCRVYKSLPIQNSFNKRMFSVKTHEHYKISRSMPWQIKENTESLFEKWHCSQLFWFSVSRNTDNKETVKLLYSRQQYKFLFVVSRGSRCKNNSRYHVCLEFGQGMHLSLFVHGFAEFIGCLEKYFMHLDCLFNRFPKYFVAFRILHFAIIHSLHFEKSEHENVLFWHDLISHLHL